MAITFDGFSLQDDNYIVSEINYRGGPRREIIGQKTARKPGLKYTSKEFEERTVSIVGAIQADSTTDLRDKIDNLFKNVVRKQEGTFVTDDGRSLSAFVSGIIIEDPHYTQTYVPYELELKGVEPYFKGSPQIINLTVVSGTTSHEYTTTISGSVFAEPQFSWTSPAGFGATTVSGISVKYAPTGQEVTWSGTGGVLQAQYGDTIQFDYANQIIVRNQTNEEPSGVFARWEPGSTSFTVTFSGTAVGGTLTMSYQPRYF